MITRQSYRAQAKHGQLNQIKQLVPELDRALALKQQEGRLLSTGLYTWEGNLFWYAECVHGALCPETVFGPLAPFLETWPGTAAARTWIPMTVVFHFDEPQSLAYWARPYPIEKRMGKIARLRPEMIASYIYFHYQLQEEQAFPGEKFKFITLHENLLFMYDEVPPVIGKPSHQGKLSTNNTPQDWAQARMDLHFIPWDDGVRFFRPIETLLAR